MSTPNQNNTQPVITEEKFIVKIKLLSNEVFEIVAPPTTPVTEFKQLVQQKTQVPVDKQRLVFSGKQLVDGTTVGDYVKESGLTVHLIARSNPPPQSAQTQQTHPQETPQQQPQPQQPQQQQQVPPRPPQMPFPIFGMMNPQMMSNPAQQGQNPNQFAQNINSAVNNLMGTFGIRLGPPLYVQPPQQQQQPPVNPPQQQQPQPPRVSNVPAQNNQLFRPLDQLQQSINRVVIMGEHTNVHANPRVNAINYLRRLQNNMLRFSPQLNRGIQLLQEGRTTHLPDLIQIFESLSASNAGAVQILRSLNEQAQQHHVHSPQCSHNHNNPQQQQQPQPPQQQQPMEVQEPQITATIVIAEDENNGQINVQMSTGNIPNAQGQSNILNTLSSFLQPGSGFNFANLFAPQPPQPPQVPQPLVPVQNAQQSQQPVASEPTSVQQNAQQSQAQEVPPQQQVPAQQPSQQQAQQQQNPLAGVNMMSIFNNLQQSGGMGAILGMSLGSMLEEEGNPTTVYSAILRPITGTEIMACFTQKDFSFFTRKRQQFREATLQAISIAGSRQDLVTKYSKDLEVLLIPQGSVNNEQVCRKRVSKLLQKHIGNVIGHFLDNTADLPLTELVLAELKTMQCQSIEEISKHTESTDVVFGNMKRGFVESFDQIIPGFAAMLYMLIERDLVRIYREYITEKKRRQEMSAEQAQDEADLLKRIETEGKQDAEEMASFEHSQFYPK